jgi:hypothetical protein
MKLFEGQYNFQDELDKTLEKKPEEKTQEYYADLAKKNAEVIIQRLNSDNPPEVEKPVKLNPVVEDEDDSDKPGDEYYGRFNKFRK